MRNWISLAEKLAPAQPIPIPPSEDANHVGNAGYKDGSLWIYSKTDGDQIGYWGRIANTDIDVAFVGLVRAGDVFYAKQVVIHPDHARKGIISEMILFIIKHEKKPLMNDTDLTPNGKDLWMSLVNSGKFDVSVVYLPTQQKFTLDQIGSRASDGAPVIRPEDDNFQDGFYDSSTGEGQRYFYLLESTRATIDLIEEGAKYSRKYDFQRAAPAEWFTAYRYFGNDDI